MSVPESECMRGKVSNVRACVCVCECVYASPGHDVNPRYSWLVQIFDGLLARATQHTPGCVSRITFETETFCALLWLETRLMY